jgi:hypothetical protein
VIEPTDLAEIPEGYRRTIARWLLERATQYRPSFLLTVEGSRLIQGALAGTATDLADPLADDSTLMHQAELIAPLLADGEGGAPGGEDVPANG